MCSADIWLILSDYYYYCFNIFLWVKKPFVNVNMTWNVSSYVLLSCCQEMAVLSLRELNWVELRRRRPWSGLSGCRPRTQNSDTALVPQPNCRTTQNPLQHADEYSSTFFFFAPKFPTVSFFAPPGGGRNSQAACAARFSSFESGKLVSNWFFWFAALHFIETHKGLLTDG